MSNRCIKFGGFFFLAVVAASWLVMPQTVHCAEVLATRAPLPLLVRARLGDTPATLARRYLKDASKGWMITEYNDKSDFSPGEAVLIPKHAFRLGGLHPDGIQVVPVLAYGEIGGGSGQNRRLSRAGFHAQMQWLSNHGFSAVRPDQLVDFMAFSGQLPRQAVLITADTESLSFYEQAVPTLREFGWTATVFVAAGKVGRNGAMTWDQIRQLQREGFTIGCRGRNGRSLLRQKKGQSFQANFNWVAAEMRQAKQTIEAALGEPCRYLAYPEGRSNRLVAAMAAKLGFSAAFNRLPGSTPFFGDRFSIHRNRIDPSMASDQLGKLLTTTMAMDLHR